MNILLTCCTQLLEREVLARLLGLGNIEVPNLFWCPVQLIPNTDSNEDMGSLLLNVVRVA